MSRLHPYPFIYLRHGETDWNKENRLQGRTDVALNAKGIGQAEAARDALAHSGVTVIYHSPLARARRTAEIVNETLGLPMQSVDDLREASFGEMEGQITERGSGSWYEAWQSGYHTPAGAECFEAFVFRALTAINSCLQDAQARGARPLIVAHGGVYWAVRRGAGLTYEGPIANAMARLHLPTDGANGLKWRIEDLSSRSEPSRSEQGALA